MKSSWHRGREAGHHAPVEMRFIDMFMTALGSLVFLALLLVFLLPKTTQLKASEEEIRKQLDDLIAENKQLRGQVAQQGQAHGSQTEDKNIVKRWLGVLLVTSGCRPTEPELYVRWEGRVVNFENGQPMPDMPEFDASNVTNKSVFVGHSYFEVGDGPESGPIIDSALRAVNGTSLEVLKNNGLHAKLFYGVGSSGSWSIYAGLRDPSGQADMECTVYPVYLSSQGLVPGERIAMTRQRPFAWLRRFKLNHDGSTTLGTAPRGDEEFKRAIADFSNKQSQALCEKKSLCGTIDAHYSVLNPSALPPAGTRPITAEEERALKSGDAFKECALCPEVVVVPTGSFIMGSPQNQVGRDANEGPQHSVELASSFAVGRFAVTFDEWDACVADGGCNGYKPEDQNWGRGPRPVINISWDDAKAYVAWLSSKTGKAYRLLSEAEREYVTRAGSKTAFWWGDAISTNQANYDGNFTYNREPKGRYRQQTAPVKSFEPNPWGLYQVHGNVWEWTEDCYRGDYHDAPTDASPWASANCALFVLRGGSWRNNPKFLRSAYRIGHAAESRSDNFGLRVARSLSSAPEVAFDGAKPLSEDQERALKPKDIFKECDACPAMVVVSSGSLIMGSPLTEKERSPDEAPPHEVTFAKSFAAGRFAVTFDEWDACVTDNGCNGYRPDDQKWGRGRRPVINASWDDASAYVAWLSRKTGKVYRLLSESEREYATRAGSKTAFWWGDTISTDQANYNGGTYAGGFKGRFRGSTSLVDSFEPNPWGLYQVHGNVWEWTEDCYREVYGDAPTDGSPWTSENCSRRALRGGSWVSPPKLLRSAARLAGLSSERDNNNGFRVARTITSPTMSKIRWTANTSYGITRGYRFLTTNSKSQCEKECLNDAACIAAEFNNRDKYCHLYTTQLKSEPSSIGSEVGVKE